MTPANPAFPASELHTVLHYDAESGLLYWRERPLRLCSSEAHWKRWNKQFAGKEAFCHTASGYRRGTVLGHHLFAHRVIWAMQTGEWPKGCIDHIDGNPTNNRLDNLRAVSAVENSKNRAVSIANKSGKVGVRRVPGKGYRVTVGNQGRPIHIGFYVDFRDAEVARDAAERALGYYKGHGRRRSRALIAQEVAQ